LEEHVKVSLQNYWTANRVSESSPTILKTRRIMMLQSLKDKFKILILIMVIINVRISGLIELCLRFFRVTEESPKK
jgi:hypothetical protein